MVSWRVLGVMLVFMIAPSKTAIGHREHAEDIPEDTTTPDKPHGNKVLLILMDGMRYDAVSKEGMKGFEMMKKHGVYTKEGLRPCFPSVSFTNYYCITTGMYAESHGMVGNDIYDKATNKTFLLRNYPSGLVDQDPMWWTGATPIWVSATEQGKRVKLLRWPGCEIPRGNYKPTPETCQSYTGGITAEDLQGDVDSILTDLADDKVDFAAIYQEEPDHINHLTGVWSPNATRVVKTLATAIEHLQKRTQMLTMSYDGKTRLEEVLDVIIVSDHGHINTDPANTIDVRSPVIKPDDVVFMMSSGFVLYVWPKEGKADSIYAALRKLEHTKAFKREDIPEYWHFKNNDRIPDLIAVADVGYYFISDNYPNRTTNIGHHGYNNSVQEMAGIFMARGPHFKENYEVSSMDNIQVYQIMCAILGINALPNNGTWSTVKTFLVDLTKPKPPPVSFRSVVITVIVALVAVVLITCLVCVCYYSKQQNRTKQYRTLPTNIENELEADELDL